MCTQFLLLCEHTECNKHCDSFHDSNNINIIVDDGGGGGGVDDDKSSTFLPEQIARIRSASVEKPLWNGWKKNHKDGERKKRYKTTIDSSTKMLNEKMLFICEMLFLSHSLHGSGSLVFRRACVSMCFWCVYTRVAVSFSGANNESDKEYNEQTSKIYQKCQYFNSLKLGLCCAKFHLIKNVPWRAVCVCVWVENEENFADWNWSFERWKWHNSVLKVSFLKL